jgi:hypothetical protein
MHRGSVKEAILRAIRPQSDKISQLIQIPKGFNIGSKIVSPDIPTLEGLNELIIFKNTMNLFK